MMDNIDLSKRTFLKGCLIGIASLFVTILGLAGVIAMETLRQDQIGVLYSKATGVVLRIINPDRHDQHHLTWLQNNLPPGTSLLRMNKAEVGANDKHCPHLPLLIPLAQSLHGVTLSRGVPVSVLDQNGMIVHKVMACPVLYQQTLDSRNTGHKVALQVHGNIGDRYDLATNTLYRSGQDKVKLAQLKKIDPVG
jgi:hypothetical protein